MDINAMKARVNFLAGQYEEANVILAAMIKEQEAIKKESENPKKED